MEFLRGWKTVLWNVLNIVVLAMTAFEAQYGIPAEYHEVWIAVYAAVNLLLRYDTRTAIGQRS